MAPAAWLKVQPAPEFCPGHTLPPLARFGWSLDFDSRIEFAASWGYCLELAGGYWSSQVCNDVLKNPQHPEARMVELAARQPEVFRLQVITGREVPRGDRLPPATWTRNAAGMLLNGQAKSLDGMVWSEGMDPIFSPEAPDEVWREMGKLKADPLRRLRERCPIAVVINGGEHGLPVAGWGHKAWGQDPAIVKAKGRRSWAEYGGERFGNSQRVIADEVKKAVPDRTLYAFYPCGGVGWRNSYDGWMDWGADFGDLQGITDLPNGVAYYKEYNTGWTWEGGRGDLLTQLLNARGREIGLGQPLGYYWLCGGYEPKPDMISDIARYVGFLKMCYTAGMAGGVAGYFAYPEAHGTRGFDAAFPADDPPAWIQQMVALSRVHAQFSFFEPYLREGDLLGGPDKHRWSKDQPAYEFPTGHTNTRVVARRLRASPRWLITAWAADGERREVEVTIPDLGEVKLLARPCGTVHKAKLQDGKAVVGYVDTDDDYWMHGRGDGRTLLPGSGP